MIIKIRNKNKITLGTLEVERDKLILKDFDGDAKNKIESLIQGGVPLRVEKYDKKSGEFVILEKKIGKENKWYPLALRDLLRNSNFIVEEMYSKVDKEIMEIVSKLPEDDEDRKEIIRRMPELTHLDKTYLLRELKK